MGIPQLQPGEAIVLTRFAADPNKALGVYGIARQFTLRQEMSYADVWGGDYSRAIPTDFRVDLDMNMLALRTVLVDVGEDIWTPPPAVLPQPRLP